MKESKIENPPEYAFSLDLQTPNALSIIKRALDQIEESNDGIVNVLFEVESTEPFKHNIFESEIHPDKNNMENPLTVYPPNSLQFKISSVLLHEDTPIKAADILKNLEDTNWEIDSDELNKVLNKLVSKKQINKNKNSNSSYVYELTDKSEKLVKKVEEYIDEINGSELYKEIESKTLDYECDVCGAKFETGGGLGSHKYFKHDLDSDSKMKQKIIDEDKDSTSEITIQPNTNKFYCLSVLYNSGKPVTPKDIESRLENTPWAFQRSSISATLGPLHDEDIVTRERRRGEHGKPYEYQLTDKGEKLTEEVINRAKSNDALTFEDVVEGK